ncbi:MAG: archease [Anaerolineae bacterium]|nr:archease [Anaerolineae bacterium]
MTRRVTDAPFEEIEHTADFALRVRGATLDKLFANAARGMVMAAGAVADTTHRATRRIDLEALDVETLLVDWLSELVYFMEQERLLFTDYDVQATPTALRAEVRGGPLVEVRRHIKAVTFHNLAVVQHEGGLEATIVFDV